MALEEINSTNIQLLSTLSENADRDDCTYVRRTMEEWVQGVCRFDRSGGFSWVALKTGGASLLVVYAKIRLNTRNVIASHLYESLGFEVRVEEHGTHTLIEYKSSIQSTPL